MARPFRVALILMSAACTLAAVPALAAARIAIVNTDAAGEGFNDPTPAAPVGSNPGTTRGEQRLIAFEHAAGIWAAHLDSQIEILIQAGFDPLPCSSGSAVLGAAGTLTIHSDFPGAEYPRTWYPSALANKLAMTDLAPETADPWSDDIAAVFNSALDDPSCLGNTSWYYGLDNLHGTDLDLVTVLLHEFAHGLGFISFVDLRTGENPDPENPDITDIYARRTLDTASGLHWDEMSAPERRTSAVNVRRLVWDGTAVSGAAPGALQRGTPLLLIDAPASIAGRYPVGTAAFGPPLSDSGVTGQVVQALDPADGAGPTTFDGCTPLTNAPDVAGRIALVDRGACTFVVKVRNAQNAGAIAVLVADNAPGSPPAGLGGADPSLTIPAVRISRSDGQTIRAQLDAGVFATLGVDPSVLAGADPEGRVLLNATDPVQPGSSVAHWDPITTPNQLMEPALNSDLGHFVDGVDLTLAQMRDVGWYPDEDLDGVPDGDDSCPGSDLGPLVLVGTCATGVPNAALGSGCTISDRIGLCVALARNHGELVSCTARTTTELRRQGALRARQRAAIIRCAAHEPKLR